MPTVPDIALCSKLCRPNPTDPTQNKEGGCGSRPPSLDPQVQIDKYKKITEFDILSRHLMIYRISCFQTCDNIILSVIA